MLSLLFAIGAVASAGTSVYKYCSRRFGSSCVPHLISLKRLVYFTLISDLPVLPQVNFWIIRFVILSWITAMSSVYRSRYSDSLRAGRSWDRIPVGGEIFPTRRDRPCGPPSLLNDEYPVFPGGKAAGAWGWPHLAVRWKKEQSYASILPLGLRGLLPLP